VSAHGKSVTALNRAAAQHCRPGSSAFLLSRSQAYCISKSRRMRTLTIHYKKFDIIDGSCRLGGANEYSLPGIVYTGCIDVGVHI